MRVYFYCLAYDIKTSIAICIFCQKSGGIEKSVDKMSKICYIIGVKDIKVSKSIKKEIVI